MGEYKNTILAILLSLVVVVGWQYFIGYPQMQRQEQQAALKKQEQAQTQPGAAQPNAGQPNAAQPNPTAASGPPVPNAPSTAPPAANRDAVIAASPHIAIDTPRLSGSVDLKGGRIDNLSLTQYREEVDPNSPPIVLF
ncbi:MAG: membrane protein insertase YidC, partial [Xanthobacteraceae bacterium]